MSEQKQILSIIDNLGGRENIKNYYHCATRLRFNLFDYDKINKDALKANPLILSVVQASGQCQLIIGNKVEAVYSALHSVLETDGQNSTPSSSGTATNRNFTFILVHHLRVSVCLTRGLYGGLVASAPDVLALFVAFDRFIRKGPLHAHSGHCSLAFLHAIRGKV